ncbi:MAG TPA: hypothetical protein VGC89_03045 [Pyrinomonadaceae bacterium]
MKNLALKLAAQSIVPLLLLALVWLSAPAVSAQGDLSAQGKDVYSQLKAAALTGGSAQAKGLTLKRDRAVMTFDGVFYLAAPVEGRVTGAYQTLIYNKGALVLRMLHFLMSNPSSGDDQAFFAMMTDFVNRYRDSFASTDDFRAVANEHFAKTPIAQKHKLKNLNWFFNQWVYQSDLPSYQMDYQIQDQPDGSVIVSGNITQENAPDNWFMPLVITFGEKKWASGTVHAYGPRMPFEIKLPTRPKKLELDPGNWILSEKTSTKGK